MMSNRKGIAIVKRFWADDEMSDAPQSRDVITAYLRGRYQDVREIDDKLLETPQELISAGVGVIIVPTQRWFYESRFEGLVRFAESGGCVLATYPSFWKTENGEGVIDRRLFSLFLVNSDVLDRRVTGKMIFRPSTEAWLFDGLPIEIQTKNDWGWVITSTKGVTEGEWQISKALEWLSQEDPDSHDEHLDGRSSNLCLVRKWDNGGLFIYTCFHYGLWLKNDPRLGKLMDNIIGQTQKKSDVTLTSSDKQLKSLEKQVKTLKILLAIAVLIVGLLVSRFFFPSTDFSDIAKSVTLAVFSGLITYIMASIIGKSSSE